MGGAGAVSGGRWVGGKLGYVAYIKRVGKPSVHTLRAPCAGVGHIADVNLGPHIEFGNCFKYALFQ